MEELLPQLNHFVLLPEEDETELIIPADSGKLSTRQVMKLKCVECLPDEVDAGIDVEGGIHVSEFFFYESGSGSIAGSTSGSATGSSGQDSGLSDPEGFTPPPLRNRRNCGIDDDSRSDVSADSLAGISSATGIESAEWMPIDAADGEPKSLPHGLLEEIRMQALKLAEKKASGERIIQELHVKFAPDSPTQLRASLSPPKDWGIVEEEGSALWTGEEEEGSSIEELYRFHLRENQSSMDDSNGVTDDDLSFVGIRDILSVEKGGTIRSVKGTVRGVRNRVRAGITTYLQGKTSKSYGEREQGKVVVYTTSMGVVRQTYQRCLQVQRILGTLLVAYEERDVSMNRQIQLELMERMNKRQIVVPQVFVEGQYLGDADLIEKLNEAGDLRQILRRYKRIGQETICDSCGGFRYLPCPVCNGSKKSIHRNHFTTEFVALKCINCNEAGLIRCNVCAD